MAWGTVPTRGGARNGCMAATGSNSRFAVTCGLLRQYVLREQRMVEAVEEVDSRTMQLFPTRAGTAWQPSHDNQPEEAQANSKAALTILYEGRVLVFEDFPADKAKELMQLAESGSWLSMAPHNSKGAAVPAEKPAAIKPAAAAVPSDLPIARKASLQRFLQKRKERIGAAMMEPYLKPKVAPEKNVLATGNSKQVMNPKEEPAASWLQL